MMSLWVGIALAAVPRIDVRPTVFSQPVSTDADDPAIWRHRQRPERSVVYGTDKTAAPDGGLYVFRLDGTILQRVSPLDRPNNVDVAYGLPIGTSSIDVAVTTERLQRRLRIFRIDRQNGRLSDVSGSTDVFLGEVGEQGAPMGIATYRGPDGHVYAVISPKEGPRQNILAEYRLVWNSATGRVDTMFVRRFGRFSGVKEIEALAIDPQRRWIYASDETVGNRVTTLGASAEEIDFFNRTGRRGDHEGIAVVPWSGRTYIVVTDQLPNNSVYRVFRREGTQHRLVGEFRLGADETDGLEIHAQPMGPRFPNGMIVAMDSKNRRFVFARWDTVARRLGL